MGKIVSLALVFILGFTVGASQADAGLLFYDDCENMYTLSEWRSTGQAPTYSKEQSRTGTGSYKFNQAVKFQRSELLLNAPGLKNFKYDTEYWFGWSVYIPSDLTFTGYNITGQFHDTEDACHDPINGACDERGQNPMLSMQLNPNDGGYRYKIVTMAQPDFCGIKGVYQDWNAEYSSNINLNAWNDVVVHVKFNYDSPGITKVWVNGTLVMNSTKPNAYNDYIGPYLKIGTYVASKDMAAPNTVYFDEIRVGDAKSSYYEVAPNGGGTPVLTKNLVAPKLKIESTN